jgi:IS30 family transposase
MPKGEHIKFKKEFEKEILRLFDSGKSATAIGKITNKFTSSILRVLKRNNRKLNRIFQGKGPDHPQWKGGRSLHGQSGYWTIYSPNHPRKKKNNRVFEHIVIAEKKYGHLITKDTPIHHIDFNRQNNNPNNLYLCNGHKEHRDIHISLENIARKLFTQNKLGFKQGEYYWK